MVDYVKHIVFGYYGKIDVAFQVRKGLPACPPTCLDSFFDLLLHACVATAGRASFLV